MGRRGRGLNVRAAPERTRHGWLCLLAAGLCQAAWVRIPWLCTLSTMGLGVRLPNAAMGEIPTAAAHSVLTAVGMLLTFAFGGTSGQQSNGLLQAVSALDLIAFTLR